jgi:hypothetical protein
LKFDLEPGTDSVLANLSTRGFVGTGDNVMIGGVIVGSGDSAIMIFRAMGPSLTSMGIVEPLMDHDLAPRRKRRHDRVQRRLEMPQLRPCAPRISSRRRPRISHRFCIPSGAITRDHPRQKHTTGVALVEAYRIQQRAQRIPRRAPRLLTSGF